MCPEAHGLKLRRKVLVAGWLSGRLIRGVLHGGGLLESFFAGLAQGLDAGEGAPDDVLEVSFATLEEVLKEWIFAGQGAEGIMQTLEFVGGRPGGEFEEDGFALDGPEAVETPRGGADFLDSGLLDGVARRDAQGVLAEQFLEALARLFFEEGGGGEQV